MIIERFESFSKKLYEYNFPSESTIIPKLKEVYAFKEQKNYKYSVKIGCDKWDIMKDKDKFYDLFEDNRIFFIFKDDELLGYYADPKNEEHFGYIIDCNNIKYNFEDNHSYLKLSKVFPTLDI